VTEGRSSSVDPLDGIDLLIFDKDGTLIEFHHMWGPWVEELARRLEGATGLPLREGLYSLLGVERATGRVEAHGLMAATPMRRLREVVEEYVSDAGAGPAAAADAVGSAWHAPDPVALAQPVTDLKDLLAALRHRVPAFAVATSDDRDPTERTLAALGIAGEMAALACADDGIRPKPAPDPVLHLCAALGSAPARTAVVGDSPADMRMARAAGAGRVIGVLSGVGDRASLAPLADVVLGSIEDLREA
jgi:phosphoglycolate phosphatase